MRLDVPLQQALFKGLASWRADTEEAAGTSQPDSLTSALQLRAVVAEQPPAPLPLPLPPTTSTSTTTRPNRPPVVEFSGEWSRLKVYLCAPCGRIFDDFYQLHDHQAESHASVLYRHVEVDETWRAALDQLRSQVGGTSTALYIMPRFPFGFVPSNHLLGKRPLFKHHFYILLTLCVDIVNWVI